jgi:hypothetical protein
VKPHFAPSVIGSAIDELERLGYIDGLTCALPS